MKWKEIGKKKEEREVKNRKLFLVIRPQPLTTKSASYLPLCLEMQIQNTQVKNGKLSLFCYHWYQFSVSKFNALPT